MAVRKQEAIKKRKLINKSDFLIIAFLIFLILAMLYLFLPAKDENLKAVIMKNSEPIKTVYLCDIDEPEYYKIDGEFPLTVKLENDGVIVTQASCNDKVCLHTGKITHSKMSITCLPAKVSIYLESDTVQNSPDVFVGR